MKLYTRSGDQGETALFDGTRVSKADPRVDAYGHVDELNALLGVALASGVEPELGARVGQVQRDLFAVGALLADPSSRISARVAKVTLDAASISRLETWIDQADAELPELRQFVLPGGSLAGAILHQARTVCRRAERQIVGLGQGVDPLVIVYMNRLSDFLFILARQVNARAGRPEPQW